MKNATKFGIIIISVLFPASFALAESGEGHGGPPIPPPHGAPGIFQHLQTNLEFMFGRHGDDENAGAEVNASTTSGDIGDDNGIHAGAQGAASSTHDINDDKGGLRGMGFGPFASTTHTLALEHGSSTASTTHERGFGQGLPFFLQWLFGLPASTTIGDIRAQIEASTTHSTSSGQDASTTVPTPPPFGGFFARLFGFFHFGGGDN